MNANNETHPAPDQAQSKEFVEALNEYTRARRAAIEVRKQIDKRGKMSSSIKTKKKK